MNKKISNVLVTRQPDQSVEFINLLSKNGFYPFLLPLIETIPLNNRPIRKSYDYIIFTSENAVKYFYPLMDSVDFKYVVAVGDKTKKRLEDLNIVVDFVPDEFSADGLIKLYEHKDLDGKTFLAPTTKKSNDYLKKYVEGKGGIFEKCFIYDTILKKYPEHYIDAFLVENNIDTLIFASPSAVESFFSQINDLDKNCYTFVAIGKVTARKLEANGVSCVFPEKYTILDVVSLLKKIRENGG